MTLAQLEERVVALEEAVEELRKQQPCSQELLSIGEEEMIPGTEYPIVLSVPPKETIRCEAVVRWVRQAPQELGLSEADWSSLGLEEDDE